MSSLPDTLLLGPDDEADRLWAGASAAFGSADRSLVALCEALDLGIRTAEILGLERLRGCADGFPATVAQWLEVPDPEIDPQRDAVAPPRAIGFTEMLDLFSEAGLPCVGPRLHRGWEDRRFSCDRARSTARQTVGITLDQGWRDDLLVLSAYRNRLFRYPPPIRVEPGEVLRCFPALTRLIDGLRERAGRPAAGRGP